MQVFYDLLVFSNLLFLLMLYYNLIVTQWRGLLPYNIANPICNAIGLVVLTFLLNYFHFGAKLLGYGIVSIIGYCIFLVWLIVSAPVGNNKIPEFGVGGVNLAASMGGAFAIQTFFIPVLRQYKDPKQYAKFTLIAYLIGGSVYLYIAFAGSFGILNRKTSLGPGIKPQTIQDYFQRGQWQIAIVQVIYLIHLYSAYGEFLLICKKRFFNIFSIKQSKHGQVLNAPEIMFIIVLIGFTVGIYFGNVSIGTLIQINGAILGFFFIYLLPAAMHFKCLYINKTFNQNLIAIQMQKQLVSNKQNQQTPMIELAQRKQSLDSDHPSQVRSTIEAPDRETYLSTSAEPQRSATYNVRDVNNQLRIQYRVGTVESCPCQKPRPLLQVIDILAILGMIGLGAFIMVDGFISVITGEDK